MFIDVTDCSGTLSADQYEAYMDQLMSHPRNLNRNKRDISESASKIISGLMTPEKGKDLMNPFAAFFSKLGIPIDESFHSSPKHIIVSSYPSEDGVLYHGLVADAGDYDDVDGDISGFEDEMIDRRDDSDEDLLYHGGEPEVVAEGGADQENKLESMISEIKESLSEAANALHDLTDSYDNDRRK